MDSRVVRKDFPLIEQHNHLTITCTLERRMVRVAEGKLVARYDIDNEESFVGLIAESLLNTVFDFADLASQISFSALINYVQIVRSI